MTREQALKASRALDAIESFEMLADHIENVIDQYADDIPDFSPCNTDFIRGSATVLK